MVQTRPISELQLSDLVSTGLAHDEAQKLLTAIQDIVGLCRGHPPEIWREVVARKLLRPEHRHSLHQLVYNAVYSGWDAARHGPPLYWFPSPYESRYTNLGRIMEEHGPRLMGGEYRDPVESFKLFYEFSLVNLEIYYALVLKEISVWFREAPRCILDDTDKSKPGGTWLPGSVLNIAECCLLPSSRPRRMDNSVVIVWRDEEGDDSALNQLTLQQLRHQVMIVANALDATFSKEDVIAIDMPMTVTAVVIYLAIVLSGRVAVTIADSFATREIATRLRVSKAKAVFTQDFIIRGGRKFPLYSRVVEAAPDIAVVLPAVGKSAQIPLRTQDISWEDFLGRTAHLERPHDYSPVYRSRDSLIHILFSSGTTGDPKAIPWTQISPIRATADTWAHFDIQVGEVFCWPTSLGWMMGPLLVFACFLSGATLALYQGSPLGRGFGKFVQVFLLGLLLKDSSPRVA